MIEHAAGSGTFLQISDIHLDPWYNESLSKKCFCNRFGLVNTSGLTSCIAKSTQNIFGQHGCDAPYALLQRALAAAAANAPKGGYDWILVTGDYVRHGMRKVPINDRAAAVREIIQTVRDLIRKHFPDTVVHHGLGHDVYLLGNNGNNDFPGDYNITLTDPKHGTNPWFASLVPMLLPKLDAVHGTGQPFAGDPRATFSRGGYFLERLTPDLCVLSINTAVYHRRHSTDDPFGQFKWLRSVMMELRASTATAGAAARQTRALIVGHIPPVIDHFKFKSLWEASYARSYLEIVSQNADLIAGQLFAHLHTPLIRLLPFQGGALPLFVAGGVSPIYENNPSFRVWHYSGSQLLDYTDFYGDLVEDGPQDSFNFNAHLSALKTFNLSSLEAKEWHKKVVLKLETSDDVWRRYMSSLYLKDKGHMFEAALKSPVFRAKAMCSIENIHQIEFQQCLAEKGI
jgi:3',5'-cyclic AMP phosphodiesterase CpdA